MPFGGFCPLPLRLGGSDLEGWAPNQHARMCADITAVRRTSPFAIVGFTLAGGIVEINSYRAQHSIALFDAPYPSAPGPGTTITFNWQTVYSSPYDEQLAVNFINATGTVHGPTAGRLIVDTITPSTIVVTPVRRDTGATLDARCTLVVY